MNIRRCKNFDTVLIALSACTGVLFAEPKINIDNKDFNMGILKPPIRIVEHTFFVTNNGTSPLIITKVKPSCGCTDINYDTIIAEKQSGKFNVKVSLKEGTSDFSKYVIVQTNALNEKYVKLTLSGKILLPIEILDSNIHCTPDFSGISKNSITLKSTKSDLMIKEITFNQQSGDANSFQLTISAINCLRSEQVDQYGCYCYTISFKVSNTPKSLTKGEFSLFTNHPDNLIVSIAGIIDPVKK